MFQGWARFLSILFVVEFVGPFPEHAVLFVELPGSLSEHFLCLFSCWVHFLSISFLFERWVISFVHFVLY